MNQKQKGKYVGLLGALLVHLLAIAFLFIVGFSVPERAEEEGLPVMLGEVQAASGLADPTLVKVDVMPTAVAQEVETPTEADMLTQDMEETVAIEPHKAPEEKKKEVKQPEKSAAEKAEEARRLAEAEAERKRKEVEEAARRGLPNIKSMVDAVEAYKKPENIALFEKYTCVEISKVVGVTLNQVYEVRKRYNLTDKQNPIFIRVCVYKTIPNMIV